MTFPELIEHEKKRRRLIEDIKRIQETEELVEVPLPATQPSRTGV